MTKTFETAEKKERVILVAVNTEGNDADVETSLEELQELADTAGAETVGKLIQRREAIHPGTYVGKGKIQELADLVRNRQADAIVCDDELSPAQITNLSETLQVKVIDRTVMILDIFAAHARTSEGKLQVELAQLRYRASRLTGLGKSLSRLGGGIGTRGPGEKKLEMDRRLIQDRISLLNRQLKEVVQNRDTMRRQRSRSQIPTVAIVGYTNAGKSTLLNALTQAEVLEEDKLFATLDPTTRSLEREDGQKILFTDTVGFISKLPHQLVRAFRSTLEEAKYADLILHVVDASNPHKEHQMEVVYDTLEALDITGKPVLTAFNKVDVLSTEPMGGGEILLYENTGRKDTRSDASVSISAREGMGLEQLLEKIVKMLDAGFVTIERLFPYEEAGKIQIIRQQGRLEVEEYREDGIFVRASVPPALAH
ncbi:MAG: GTPase HflX [Lachnospiraceae bacterium]|nr:GTPase HflX [Lachnospiraceae bacterium]